MGCGGVQKEGLAVLLAVLFWMMTEYNDRVVNVGRGGGRAGTLRVEGGGGETTSLDCVDMHGMVCPGGWFETFTKIGNKRPIQC